MLSGEGRWVALHLLALAVLDLGDLFGRNLDLEDELLHVQVLDPGLEVGLDLVLVAGVGVHDVPLAGRVLQGLAKLGGGVGRFRLSGRSGRLHGVSGVSGAGGVDRVAGIHRVDGVDHRTGDRAVAGRLGLVTVELACLALTTDSAVFGGHSLLSLPLVRSFVVLSALGPDQPNSQSTPLAKAMSRSAMSATMKLTKTRTTAV
jgi:hypothetical protein